jgi:hypothetical protein
MMMMMIIIIIMSSNLVKAIKSQAISWGGHIIFMEK